MMCRRITLLLLLGLLPSMVLAQQAPLNPDQLLQKIRNERAAEVKAMAQREQAFLADRNEQARLLSQAKKALAHQEAEAARLKALFEKQETLLVEQSQLLKERVGDLGALFAVIRQSAGDIAGQWKDSLLNLQYPERLQSLQALAESRTLPTSDDIDSFWMTVLEDMAASGRVEQVSLPVVQVDGSQVEMPVLRVGTFGVYSQSDQAFLLYDPRTGDLLTPPQQPSGSSDVQAFLGSTEDVAPLPVDITRGSLLVHMQHEPTLLDRIKHGGIIGGVILGLGAIGVLLAIVRLVYLMGVSSKVSRQMKDMSHLHNDNPLGRVIGVLGANPKLSDLETLELKLDEAILQETPKLDKGNGLLKLLSAVAPLLGLLGTVTGMILTFQAITQSGGGDARLMADGISQALMTTVLGLVVAIPLLFLHALLASRSKSLVQILEQQSAGLIALHLSGASRRD